MEANPYSTPTANVYGTSSGDAVSPSTIAQLAGTKPWVRFMSVLMLIAVIFMILGAAGMVIIRAAGMNNMGGGTVPEAGILVGMAIYYGVLAFVMIYPTIKLWKFASSIGRLNVSLSVADLDTALAEQRRYWKFMGIMMILFISLSIVGVIAGIAFGATMARSAGAF